LVAAAGLVTIMTKSRRKQRKHPGNSPGLVILGAGLILLGLAAIIAWPREPASTKVDPGNGRTVPVSVEYAAPDLTLQDLAGAEHSLAEYRGKVVLVNLWATWCPPCTAEMPTLLAYYHDHAAQGFVIVAISDGDPAPAVADFVREYSLTFPVWLDPTYIATEKAFKTRNLPSSFVIDREGTIRLRWVGEIDRTALEDYVTPLIVVD
jgi:peroxiredoxin